MAVDPYSAFVVFLSGFAGADATTAFVDEAKGKTVTANGNAQVDTAQFKFGTSSLLLDGTGDFLSLADSADWVIGTNQFTIEAWVRFSGTPKDGTIIAQASTSSEKAFMFYFSSPASFRMSFTTGGISETLVSANFTPVTNTWYHVAVDRDGASMVRVYIDGVMLGSAAFAGTVYNSSGALTIGRMEFSTGFDFNGWLDEVRFTNGVARYASDGGFTVSSAAFPRPGDLPDAPASVQGTGGVAYWDQRIYYASRKRRKEFLNERAARLARL